MVCSGGLLLCMLGISVILIGRNSGNRRFTTFGIGAGASVFALWLFRAGSRRFGCPFFVAFSLTLTLGFRYALFIGGIVLFAITLVGKESYKCWVNGLLGVALPIDHLCGVLL